ncbi:MAG: hypothetical protein JWP57_2992 [Spirosoma sp.]|nr:hypothetical protein [Spirosoma sp.]
MKRILTALVFAAASCSAFAQITDTTSASFQRELTSAGIASKLSVSGYVETYYVHDFSARKTAQERPGFLYNHKRNREVTINLAFARLSYTSEGVRANLALQAGTYAQYNYAAEQEMVRPIFEANAGVKLSTKRDLWLDAGIFSSHIGFESAVSKDCWTLTRSIVAENSPYYLSGVKVTYTTGTTELPTGKWTLIGSVVNGWQHIRRPAGYSGPSFSTQVQYQPSAKLTLNWSSFIGSDQPDSLHQRRVYTDLYAIINPTERFGVILGFDIGTDTRRITTNGGSVSSGNYVWYSPVMIARYKTTNRSYVNGRFEYYDDQQGVIISIPGFQTVGYSVGYDYALLDGMALFRLEGKVYESKMAIFETAQGLRRTNVSLTTSLAVSF